MLNDLLMFCCIWFDEIVFRNDMIIFFYSKNLFLKTTIRSLSSLSFIFILFYYIFLLVGGYKYTKST